MIHFFRAWRVFDDPARKVIESIETSEGLMAAVTEGNVVELHVSGKRQRYWTRVKFASNTLLEIDTPKQGRRYATFPVGTILELRIGTRAHWDLCVRGCVAGSDKGTLQIKPLQDPLRSERRRNEIRVPAEMGAAVAVPEAGNGGQVRGTTVDVSPSGAAARFPVALPAGSCVSLSLSSPQGYVDLEAEVLACKPMESNDAYLARFRFVTISETAEATLARIVFDYQRRRGVETW